MDEQRILSHDFINDITNAIDSIPWQNSHNYNLETIRSLYFYTGIEYQSSELINKVNEALKSALFKDGTISAEKLFYYLIKTYSYKELLENERFSLHRKVFGKLRAFTKDEKIDPENLKSFTELGRYLMELNFLNDFKLEDDIYSTSSRNKAVSNSVKKLKRKFGLSYTIVHGDLFISHDEIRRIGEKISNRIRNIGGLNFINLLLGSIDKKFDQKNNRYEIPLKVSQVDDKLDPAIPYGYLYELCLKHPFPCGPVSIEKFNQNDAIEIIHDSRALFSLTDVEPYNIWETEFKEGLSAIKLIGDLTLLESNLKFPQSDFMKIIDTLNGLFSWIPNDISYLDFAQIMDFLSVIVLHLSRNGVIAIEVDEIKKRIQDPKIINELISIFVHSKLPNQDFFGPSDFNHADSFFRPFFLENSRVYIPNRTWVSIPFYEAIFSYYKHIPDFSSKVGKAFETYLETKFKEIGITYYSGKYKVSKDKTEEVDFILDIDDSLIFIEVKKKSLTRESRGGNPTTGLIDIHQSLLDSQIQALKHEVFLLERSELAFENGKKVKLLNKKVEKASVILWDYGAVQDRSIVKQVLQLYYMYSFSPAPGNGKEIEKRYGHLNKKCSQFRDLINRRHTHHNTELFQHLMGCWFLSLSQILLMLNNSSSPSEFLKEFKRMKHITYKSLDFYFEYKQSNRIQNIKPDRGQFMARQPKID